jgi:two-component system OmpR family response regulator
MVASVEALDAGASGAHRRWPGLLLGWAMPRTARTVPAVDDGPTIRRMVADQLGGRGFDVATAADGTEMPRALAGGTIHLVLLDLKLPDGKGLDLLRDLRARSEVPIIVLTGHRREAVDRVLGLELGAEDYLTKPFGRREVPARIPAMLRRGEVVRPRPERPEASDAPGGTGRPTRHRSAGWELGLRVRLLRSPGGGTVPLPGSAFNLLTAFLRPPGRVPSREQLLAASRIHDDAVIDRSIDVQILRLRRARVRTRRPGSDAVEARPSPIERSVHPPPRLGQQAGEAVRHAIAEHLRGSPGPSRRVDHHAPSGAGFVPDLQSMRPVRL